MTVTSTLRPTAADMLGAGHNHASAGKASAHSANDTTFSQLLKAGIQRDKSELKAASVTSKTNESKPRTKTEKSEDKRNDRDASASHTNGQSQTKPPITGRLGLQTQPGETDAAASEATAESQSATETLTDSALSTTGFSPDAGSILMALLLQSRSGTLNGPNVADSPADAGSDDDQDQSPVEKGLAVPVTGLPLQWLAPVTTSAAQSAPDSLTVSSRAQSDIPASGPEGLDAKPVSSPGDLAFALKLQSIDTEIAPAPSSHAQSAIATDAASSPVPAPAVHAAPFASSSSSGNEEKGGEEHHREADAKAPELALSSHASQQPTYAIDIPAPADTPAPTRAAEIYEQAEAYSSEPVHNVHVQVVGEDQRRVDLRLSDRGGSLRVSVKSGDTALNGRLQQQMPDLTARLQAARYQTEVWTPVSSATDSENQDPNSSSSQRPAWVDELEAPASSQTERIS